MTAADVAPARPRPRRAAVWWLGWEKRGAYAAYPVMGECQAGTPLPAAARYWCQPGVPGWVPVPRPADAAG